MWCSLADEDCKNLGITDYNEMECNGSCDFCEYCDEQE